MPYEVLQSLIDKQDNQEIIRDQIGLILFAEIQNQQALAAAQVSPVVDPNDWNLKIYLERTNPFEEYLNIDVTNDPEQDFVPLVNIWYDADNVNQGESNVIKTQAFTGIFNIDVYGFGFGEPDGQGGHIPGDKKAAFEAQRAMRLVRNILMSSTNKYLQLQKTVYKRMTLSRTFFKLKPRENQVQRVHAGRLQLEVHFSEESPQFEGGVVNSIHVKAFAAENGLLINEITSD